MKKQPYLKGLHYLCGRAKLMPSQRLKSELKALENRRLSQLESIFKDEITLPKNLGYKRVFDRATTFWTFLSQVLSGGSCRDATRQVQAQRGGLSSANVAFCKARRRLPLDWIEQQGRRVAGSLQARSSWRWQGRRVLLADATSCQLADTPANQKLYPQPVGQKPGCGHPVMQLVGVFDLGSGALLGWEKSPWNVHEAAMFEKAVLPRVEAGDVLVADRAYDAYRCFYQLKERGADAVIRMHSRRKCTLKQGQDETIVTLERGATNTRPKHCSKEQWEAMPKTQTLRLVRVKLEHNGFRSKDITLITTLLDVPAKEIADLYLRRWQIEVCFRDIKTTLGMELLRGKSPAICEREVAMHLLAYNLLRTLMIRAAEQEIEKLEAMSFAGTRDATCRFAPVIAQAKKKERKRLIEELLRCIGTDKVPRRPGRSEPRAVKRRPKSYQHLTKPRKQMQTSPSRKQK